MNKNKKVRTKYVYYEYGNTRLNKGLSFEETINNEIEKLEESDSEIINVSHCDTRETRNFSTALIVYKK